MKKFLSFFAFALLAISMVACGDDTNEPKPDGDGGQTEQPVDKLGDPQEGLYCTVSYYEVDDNNQIVDDSIEYCNMALVKSEAGYDLYGLLNLPIFLVGDYDAKEKTTYFNGDFYQMDNKGNKSEVANIWQNIFYSFEDVAEVIAMLEDAGYDATYYRDLLANGFSYIGYVIETFDDPNAMPEDMVDIKLLYSLNEAGEKVLSFDTFIYDNAYALKLNFEGYITDMQYLMSLGFINRGTLLMNGNIDEERNLVTQSRASMLQINNFNINNNYVMFNGNDNFVGKKVVL